MSTAPHVLPHVLIVGRSENRAARIARELTQGGLPLVSELVESSDRLLMALEADDWDVVMLDAELSEPDRRQAIATLRGRHSELPCIVVAEAANARKRPSEQPLPIPDGVVRAGV